MEEKPTRIIYGTYIENQVNNYDIHDNTIHGGNFYFTELEKKDAKGQSVQQPHLSTEEAVKQAIYYVMGLKDEKGEYVFRFNNQWYAIYRILADKGIVKPNEFEQLGQFWKSLNLGELRVPPESRELTHYNNGTFSSNFEKWDRNNADSKISFERMMSIAEPFKTKIEELL